MDSSEVAVTAARKRIVIVLARLGLVDLDGEGTKERLVSVRQR